AAFYTIINNYIDLSISVLYMAIPLAIASLSLAPAFRVFPDAWNWATAAATGTRRSVYERITGKYASKLMRWVGWESSLILEKELVERVRSREVVGSSIAIGAVAFAIVYALDQLPSLEFIPGFLARTMPPMVVGMGLFAGVILEPGMAALGAFGKDGKGIWVLKNAPVPAREIVKAKALGAMYTAPLLAIFAAFLSVLWVGYSLVAAVFAGIMTIAMSFFAVAIGIWLGARAPNFDSSVKGYPDIVTIYIYSMLCLGICFVASAVAFVFVLSSPMLGLLAAVFMADLGAAFLYVGIGLGAVEFEAMEAP
ncbi:MAG: hypothetical protein KAT70_06595, partial [Thermoplasmata archaeon]|nr:hypothetical protein [Thermoplasmata archaeon]